MLLLMFKFKVDWSPGSGRVTGTTSGGTLTRLWPLVNALSLVLGHCWKLPLGRAGQVFIVSIFLSVTGGSRITFLDAGDSSIGRALDLPYMAVLALPPTHTHAQGMIMHIPHVVILVLAQLFVSWYHIALQASATGQMIDNWKETTSNF